MQYLIVIRKLSNAKEPRIRFIEHFSSNKFHKNLSKQEVNKQEIKQTKLQNYSRFLKD